MAGVVWYGADGLRGLLVPVGDLHLDERSFEAIRTSLTRFGQRKPIVAHGGVVVAGNGALVAAKRAGWSHIAVVGTEGLSEQEVRGFALADNRTAELSEWDYGMLSVDLGVLDGALPAVDLGWSPAELRDVSRRAERAAVSTPDEGNAEVRADGVSLPGVYQLGPHQLMVGDSTSPEAAEFLRGADLVVIAAAQTGRVARVVELDARYADAIRRRWTVWTREHGQDPGTGALNP